MQQHVYHASTNKNLSVLKPVANPNAPGQGKHVFATTRKDYAATYLLPHACGPMYVDTEHTPMAIFINNTLKTIQQLDKGGAIYTVSAQGFMQTPQQGLEDTEIVNPNTVPVISSEIYESALSAFKSLGIEVYLINKALYQEIVTNTHATDYDYLVKNSKRII